MKNQLLPDNSFILVFEILLGVSEGLSWKDAFLKVVPQRKLGSSKEDNNSTDSQNSSACPTGEVNGTCSEVNQKLNPELSQTVKQEEEGLNEAKSAEREESCEVDSVTKEGSKTEEEKECNVAQ